MSILTLRDIVDDAPFTTKRKQASSWNVATLETFVDIRVELDCFPITAKEIKEGKNRRSVSRQCPLTFSSSTFLVPSFSSDPRHHQSRYTRRTQREYTSTPICACLSQSFICQNHFLSIPSHSQSKIPSRLRESSTAFLDRDASSSPDSASSPGTLPISATPSSVHSTQTNGTKKSGGGAIATSGFGRGAGRGKAQPRMPSPPRPPVTVVRKPDTDYLVGALGVFCTVFPACVTRVSEDELIMISC